MPLQAAIDDEDAARIGDYIGQVARRFPAAHTSSQDALALMIETNVRELTGYAAGAFAADVRKGAKSIEHLPASEIDGRMLPHEWIRTSAGLTKVDALDHCRG